MPKQCLKKTSSKRKISYAQNERRSPVDADGRLKRHLLGVFTEDDYLEVRFNNHDALGPYTKVETFVAHGLAEEAGRIRRVDETLTPEQMADFVNDCAGDDCYGAEWNFEWIASRGVFEDVTYIQLYQMA